MGNPPTVLGALATLVAVCAWLVTACLAGSWSKASYLRIVGTFWATVVVGTLLAAAALNALKGGLVPPLLLLALGAPLYGLTASLSRWSPFAWGPLAWHSVIGIIAFTMTLVAYFAGRRIGILIAKGS